MRFTRKVRRPPILNIIPLIDVLVVLLIFYIATTVFKKTEPKISIKVPSSTHASVSHDASTPSIVYVTADGKMYLDDAVIDPDQLADTLKAKIAANPAFKVSMKSDTKTPFGMIVKVMDAAHTAGIADLSTFVSPAPAAGASPP